MRPLIYVVEDSEIIASIVKRVLESNPSYDVKLFSSVETALRKIRLAPPDLIITDYYFENHVNGAFLASEVRKMGVETAIFLLSGKSDLKREIISGNFNLVLDKSDTDVVFSLNKRVKDYLHV